MLDEKPELTYRKGQSLAVTIQPDDSMQGFNSPKRYQDFINYYSVKLDRLFAEKKNFTFYFRIELSEPIKSVTAPPRLHLHGVVNLLTNMSVFKWLCDVMPDLLLHARLEITHIDSLSKACGWNEYIHKQKEVMPVNAFIGDQLAIIPTGSPSSNGDEFSGCPARRA